MKFHEFSESMTYAAISSQSELLEPTLTVYWEKFKDWPADDFEAAVEWCGNNLNGRFPSVSQIRDARPKRFKTIDDIEKANGVIGGRIEHVTESDTNEIETLISKIENSGLREACRRLVGTYPQDSFIRLPRYSCSDCQDRGVIEVYDPRRSYQAARVDNVTAGQIRTMMTACSCEAGRLHREPQPSKKNGKAIREMILFDAKQMCQVTAATTEEQIEELTTFMADWKPRNYHSEFSDWA